MRQREGAGHRLPIPIEKQLCARFSCAPSPTADQRGELIERGRDAESACDRNTGLDGNAENDHLEIHTQNRAPTGQYLEDGTPSGALLPLCHCVGIISPLLASKYVNRPVTSLVVVGRSASYP